MKALFVVPSDYDALAAKGVLHMLRDRDENGMLDQIVTVHPFTRQERVIDVAPNHMLYEFKQPTDIRRRPVAWVCFALHLFRAAFRIRRLADKYGCDFVRAQDPYFSGLLGWLATRWPSRRPFCISIHADYDKRYVLDGPRGAPVVFGSRKLAKRLERFLLRHANKVLPIRESIAAGVEKIGVPRAKIAVIPHGIDMSAYTKDCHARALPTELMLEQGKHWIVFCGRLSRENYVFDLLAFAESLAKRRDDFLLVIAGDGPERASMQAQVERTRALSAHVRMLGFQSNSVVAALRKAAAIGIVPMGGFSLIEACAAAHPVLAYDVEWHAELVRGGETGFLVPEGDVGQLVERAGYLLDHPDAAMRMGQCGQALAFERHDMARASRRRLEVYRSLAGEAV